jgi:hypothetical protein
VVTLLAAVLTTAGCGGSDGPAAADGGGSSSSVATSPASPTPSTVTVEGTVRSGVEAGCLVLRADGQAYLLLGRATALPSPGSRVRIIGTANADVATFCMQGTPLQVHQVEALD